MTSSDRDLERWRSDWQSLEDPGPSAEVVRDLVRRRDRLLAVWVAGEWVVAAVALPVVGYVAWTTHEPVERLAMILLAIITVGTVAVSWWNWRGMVRVSASTTADYVSVSLERLRRLRRAVTIGWVVLGAEVAVFVVWIWHRLHGGPASVPVGSTVFAWSLLAFLVGSAAVFLVSVHRWVERDAARFEALRRELEN
jgi:hypothetical protein